MTSSNARAQGIEYSYKLPKATFGNTGVKIPILGFGTSQSSLPSGLVNMALDEGVAYIDTAPAYLNTRIQRRVGEILEESERRKDCFLVTKSKKREIKAFETSLYENLEQLRTDYVDGYSIHRLDDPDRIDDEMKSLSERLKKEGKIRFLGISCHGKRMLEVLDRAAEAGFIDYVMFRYNFRDFGNDELNRAIDKCTKAKLGLAAMKTQGAAAALQDRVDGIQQSGFNKFQAALKAVWEDERIHVAVSEMTTLDQVQENTTAARVKKLTSVERQLLRRHACETNHLYCRGCAEKCENRIAEPIRIADTLRYCMYHESYGKKEEARQLFRDLPADAREIATVDFSTAESACPYGLPIARLMRDAVDKLA